MPYADEQKQKEYLLEHYKQNKGKYSEASKAARERKKEKLAQLKDRPCTDCGGSFHHSAMQYDHLDAAAKKNSINRLMTKASWKEILEEIEKCELVCANCHAVRTYNRANNLSVG